MQNHFQTWLVGNVRKSSEKIEIETQASRVIEKYTLKLSTHSKHFLQLFICGVKKDVKDEQHFEPKKKTELSKYFHIVAEPSEKHQQV